MNLLKSLAELSVIFKENLFKSVLLFSKELF
jgi:hypothetical protein